MKGNSRFATFRMVIFSISDTHFPPCWRRILERVHRYRDATMTARGLSGGMCRTAYRYATLPHRHATLPHRHAGAGRYLRLFPDRYRMAETGNRRHDDGINRQPSPAPVERP